MLKTYMTLLIMNSDTERHFCKLNKKNCTNQPWEKK